MLEAASFLALTAPLVLMIGCGQSIRLARILVQLSYPFLIIAKKKMAKRAEVKFLKYFCNKLLDFFKT